MPAYRSLTDAATRARRPLSQKLRRAAGWAIRRIDSWIERARQRRTLAELTDDQLLDIGLSRGQASRESRKLFWKP